ncbi:MAG: kelch repeat-containing protein [Pseudomonadota bacterium]
MLSPDAIPFAALRGCRLAPRSVFCVARPPRKTTAIAVRFVVGPVFAALVLAAASGAVRAQSGQEPEWTSVTTTDGSKPTARHENAFIGIGDDLVLLGGRGIAPVELFDTKTQTWRQGAKPPFEIHHFQAVPVGNEIWAVGAFTGGYPGETPVDNVMIYDVDADEWRTGPSIPADRRRGSTGAAVVDGMIYIAGGAQDGHRGGHVAWFDRLDPATGEWTRLPDAPRARDHAALAALDGQLVFAGGRLSQAPDNTFGATVEEVDVYDIAAGTWTTLDAPLPTPRAGNMAVTFDDEILVIGGESLAQDTAHAQMDRLDLGSGTWTEGGPLRRGRHGTGAAVLDDSVWVAAGSGNRGGEPELDSLERYSDPSVER